jgi:hypothetical protein
VSEATKTAAPSWPSAMALVSALVAVMSAFTTCEAQDSERRAWQVRDRESTSREAELRETQLRHESARECCRQQGVSYATCIEAFKLVKP